MGTVAQQLEQLNKEIDAVTVKAEAAYEAYESAANDTAEAKAAWEAAESTADAKEEAKLKGRYDALKEKERRRKERYEELKKEREQLLEDRRALEAKLPGPGEHSPLLACSMVSVVSFPKCASAQSRIRSQASGQRALHARAGAAQLRVAPAGPTWPPPCAPSPAVSAVSAGMAASLRLSKLPTLQRLTAARLCSSGQAGCMLCTADNAPGSQAKAHNVPTEMWLLQHPLGAVASLSGLPPVF